jgi:hypothetical protein
MIDDIMYIYEKNFGRTNNLISLYQNTTKEKKGRRPIENLDLLRVTVVMLHSTFEDFLRNLLNWKLPSANKEKLNKIPLVTSNYDSRKTKFELGELIEHKSKSIDDLIKESVKEYLNSQSFNNTKDVTGALRDIELDVNDEIRKYFPEIEQMISRRHNIVHQADKDFRIGDTSLHRVKPINLKQIIKWQNSIDKLVIEIVRQINMKV